MTAETIALFIAGLVAPALINVIKNVLGLKGTGALWFTFLCSAIIAAVATTLVGGWSLVHWGDPLQAIPEVLAIVAAVFTLATLVYKTLMSPNK